MESPGQSGKWKLVSNVITATNLFMSPTSEVIHDVDAMIESIKRQPSLLRRERTAVGMTEIESYKYTAALFDFIRRSTPEDLVRIQNLITNNPKRYMIDNSCSDSYVNKQFNGIRPLYESCKHGFLDTVMLLIKFGADPLLMSDNGGEAETCLEVAVRWNHIHIVKYLMENYLWNQKVLRNCFKATCNPIVKNILAPKLMKKRGFCFCG